MKAAVSRWITPPVVGGLLLLVCTTEAWQIARLHARHREISRALAASPASASLPAGSGGEDAEMNRRLAEATGELSREQARLSAAEAKLHAAETAAPKLKDEELRSLGHVEQFALGTAEWLDSLMEFDREMKADPKAVEDGGEKMDQFLASLLRWQSKSAVIGEMEDTPAEIAKFHASTIAKRLELDGPTLAAVRGQIEKEFTDLAAAGLTESFCPAQDAGDWRKRRTAALTAATQRVEALIPPGRRRPDVVAQSLSLGDAFYTEVNTQADGHGSANFGLRIPGLTWK